MSVQIKRCQVNLTNDTNPINDVRVMKDMNSTSAVNAVNDVKAAIDHVKAEEDPCCSNEEVITKFLSNPSNLFYVAKEDDEVVGYAMAYIQNRIDRMSDMLCLYEIGTLRKCRQRGIAKQIINQLIANTKEMDIMKLWIPTNVSNKAACALYRSIGAQESVERDEIIFTYYY